MLRLEMFTEEHIVEVCALWNRELGRTFPMRERLLRQNAAMHGATLREGSLVLRSESGGIAGAVVSKRDGAGGGFISLLLVASSARGMGVGSRLLKAAERALNAEGVSRIALGGDPGLFFPGIPAADSGTKAWFERRGYRQTGAVHDLLGDFRAHPEATDSIAAAGGVRFEVAAEADREPLLDFVHRVFPGRWEQSTRAYFEAGGTGREFMLVRHDDGEIIGFCRMNDDQSPLLASNQFWSPGFPAPCAGIGPLGIDGSYRGSGYGLAMVAAAVRTLRERGYPMIVIDWTTLVDFYGKLGFRIWQTYHMYSRSVPT